MPSRSTARDGRGRDATRVGVWRQERARAPGRRETRQARRKAAMSTARRRVRVWRCVVFLIEINHIGRMVHGRTRSEVGRNGGVSASRRVVRETGARRRVGRRTGGTNSEDVFRVFRYAIDNAVIPV